jgi:ABC-type spermidine/putrescine transport system permease subunit I
MRQRRPAFVLLCCVPLLPFCARFIHLAAQPASALRAIGLAVCATLACLLLASPVVLSRRPAAWMVPAAGVAALGLLQLHAGAAHDAARAACAGLPLMALALLALWSTVPPGILHAAAAAGAPPAARARLFLALALPTAAIACLPVFLLCLGLLSAAPTPH